MNKKQNSYEKYWRTQRTRDIEMKETIRSTTTNIYMSFLIINKVDKSCLVWALVRLVLYECLTNWNKEKLSPYFEWSYLPWFPLWTCLFNQFCVKIRKPYTFGFKRHFKLSWDIGGGNIKKTSKSVKLFRNPVFSRVGILLMVAQNPIIQSIF